MNTTPRSDFPLDNATTDNAITDEQPDDQAPKDDSSGGADAIRTANTDGDLPKHVRNGYMRYRDFKPLTRGGEAMLQTCLDENLGRTVVMKTLLPHLQNLDVYRRRFLREARVTAQLAHPATIPVYELSRDNEGNPYFTMKRLEGDDLCEILDGIAEGNAKFKKEYPLTVLLEILVDVGQALAYAHDHGVIHRDLKPANVMVGDYGEIRILDWGLAKVENMPDDDSVSQMVQENRKHNPGRLTNPGDVQGTPFYMSPEQVTETSNVDGRTDIYNMGVVLFEVLTHQSYVSGRNYREIKRRILEDPIRNPRHVAPQLNVPPELNAICIKALQKEPEHRYQRMETMVQDIQAWLRGEAVSVYEEPMIVRLLRWRHRNLLNMAALVWFLLGAGVTLVICLVTMRG